MKTIYLHVRMLLVAMLMMLPMLATAAEGDSLYVYFNGYRLDVFPSSYIKSQMEANGQLRVTVINDTTFCYDLDRIDSVCYHRPQNMPSFSSFKFNNKYNDQVFTDAEADIAGDSLITARVGAIGKWLTPSFQLSEETDRVYIDGQRQQSKVNRHKFDKDVIYTVGRHGWREFKKTLAKEALWSDSVGRYTTTEVMLSADQFSSNLPGKDGEGFAQMLDGNPSTFFHSTWDVSSDLKPIIYVTEPYLDIALNESLRRVSFSYVTRTSGSYWPLKLTLFASNDGNEWTQIREFTEADDLPTYAGATYRSPVIDLGQDYSHLRILLQASPYRLYLVFAEFNLWRIDENPDYHGPELLEPAEYRYVMQPYGREYRMHVDWLTDLETSSVPRIDINTNTGEMISSKDYYLDATITIDGGGVYPDMSPTPVQIKGRGNSSWSSRPWDKNPYRLKFASKQKPFGLTNGKSWVLLANKQSGSMLSNAIGMKAACLAGTAGANHIVPVELYINGNYRGNYNFTEKVGIANNSIDVADEDSTALLELDTYFDETYKFRSNDYFLPVNIQFPDFAEDPTSLTQQMIVTDFNDFMRRLKNGDDINTLVDIDMLARYLLVNELIANYELQHPKSTYLYKEAIGSADSKFIFGPVWDLDWAYGYETNRQYCTTDATADYYNTKFNMSGKQFIYDLRYVSRTLDRTYYEVWTDFMNNHLDELIDYCDAYFAFANPSFLHNAASWGDGYNYAVATDNAKEWLLKRARFIYDNLNVYPVSYPEEEDDMNFDDDHADGIEIAYTDETEKSALVDVFDLNGRCVKRQVNVFELRTGLHPGIYIVGGKKMVVR